MSETYQIVNKISNSFVSVGLIPHAFVTISGPGISNPVTVGYYPQRRGEGTVGNIITGISGPGTVQMTRLLKGSSALTAT